MKPIEISQVAAARAVHSHAPQPGAMGIAASPSTRITAEDPAMLTRSTEAEAGPQPPVDAARVTEIRDAIRDGRYPLIPTRVADVIIAAGYLLTQQSEDA